MLRNAPSPLALIALSSVLVLQPNCLSPLAAAPVNHVIHISIDGLRGDYLKTRIDTSPLLYSNFKRFVDEGATTFNARTDYTHTNTIPNHTSMLTGRPVAQPSGFPDTTHHGYTLNSSPSSSATLHNAGNPSLTYIDSAFDIAHDNGLSTALYASKSKFVIYEQSYNATHGATDTTGADNGRDKIDTYVLKSAGSPSNASSLHADYLADMAVSQYNYTFLHYRDPDSAGHAAGWGSNTWNTAVQNVDDYLGDLFQLVETEAGLLNDTIIIVTSDHGGSGTSHSTPTSPTNYTIPVLVWGAGVAENANLYALNPTTRLDPATGRPDYTVATQPIRNGGTGNLALDLLGLDAVTGSLINGEQNLSVVPFSPADFDSNQTVDQSDVFIWGTHFGITSDATQAQGDADSDGDVDSNDFLIWQQEREPTSLLTIGIPVPEPSCLVLSGMCALACLFHTFCCKFEPTA